jgi:hypothetical protein
VIAKSTHSTIGGRRRVGLALAVAAAGLLSVPGVTDAAPASRQTFTDHDGDGRTDIAVWRPGTGTWWFVDSSTGNSLGQQWGQRGDWPVPADYDGDGRTDTAVWRPSTGEWWIRDSSTGGVIRTVWGGNTEADDIPVPGDYDGDGRTDIAIWRPATAAWWIIKSSTGVGSASWGPPGDWPVPGDYDGDGRTDPAVWQNATGDWWIVHSGVLGTGKTQWGRPGDWPVPGDYDGDGRTDIAVWRPASGEWRIVESATGAWRGRLWGDPEDQPVPGDYDGDGRTDAAIWRPATGSWWIITANGSVTSKQWGQRGDLPVANTQQFVPKLSLQSLTPGSEGVVLGQGSITRQVPRAQTLRVLVRGNPRVDVSEYKSTSYDCRRAGDDDLAVAEQPLLAYRPGNSAYETQAPPLCWYTSTVRATWRAGTATGTALGTFTYNPVAFDQTFTVPENLYFVDTRIDLQPGDRVVIDASGYINSGVLFSGANGPDGWGPGRFGAGVPAPTAPVYSLVAHVGPALPAFYVGPHLDSETLGGGRLFLRINDEAPGNGSGAFTVRVQVLRNR